MVRNTLSIEKLLEKSSQELADPALQEERERQLGLLIKEAAKIKSPEELEQEQRKAAEKNSFKKNSSDMDYNNNNL